MKQAAKDTDELISKAADSANNIVKSVSGEGGLIGKAADASSNVIKNASKAGKGVVDKTVDTSSNTYQKTKNKLFGNKKKDESK